MRITLPLALLLSLLAVSTGLVAQNMHLSTESQRAEKSYYRASELYRNNRLEQAVEEMRKAVAYDTAFSEGWLTLGDIYTDLQDLPEAIKAYRYGMEKGRQPYPQVWLLIANLEQKEGNYQIAIDTYHKALEFEPASSSKLPKIEKSINQCQYALEMMQHPVDFHPINLGSAINSAYSEYFPCITVDGETFLFTRRIPSTIHQGKEQEDFYIAAKSDTGWLPSKPIGEPINSDWNEGAPTLSPDGQFLFFTACANMMREYGPDRDGYGSCDLFVCRRLGSGWSDPVNIGSPINTANWESQPSFSSDGQTLYFIRGGRTRQNADDQDIYTSSLLKDGKWSTPQRLPDIINSKGKEESVFIHPDGHTLYFSSDGHPGMGGLDIFVSRLSPNGEWSKPENLGYPINTYKDENSLLVSGDGKWGYFASDRPGGLGKLDLYKFKLPESARPQQLTWLKGTVYDAKTMAKLEARFELIDLSTGKTVVESYSDPSDGHFLVALPSGKEYALNVSKNGYLFFSDHFNLTGPATQNDPFLRDIPLQPIIVGETVILRNVFFDTDSYLLKDQSKTELLRLVELMNSNPKLKIELSGHTDNKGDNKHNQELSFNRAKAVFDFLMEQKIASDRISFKGYGETSPISTNETEEGRALNRRTAFMVKEI